MLALAAPLACGIGYSAQDNKTQPIAGQQTNQNATPSEELQFKLVLMSNGVTKSGASWDGRTYETPNHTKVYLYIVHLDSPGAARKEYEDTLKGAVGIIKQEKVHDKPATQSATTEGRAVIVISDVRECNEAAAIIVTAGRALRIIKSCSAEAALEFEKQANRNEKEK
jgi:hypothetical protein